MLSAIGTPVAYYLGHVMANGLTSTFWDSHFLMALPTLSAAAAVGAVSLEVYSNRPDRENTLLAQNLRLDEIQELRSAIEKKFPDLTNEPWPAAPPERSRTRVLLGQCGDLFSALFRRCLSR